MKKRAKKEKADSIDIWPLVIVIAMVLLVLSLGFNIYYVISLSQDKSVVTGDAMNSKVAYKDQSAIEELDITEGEDSIEDDYYENDGDEDVDGLNYDEMMTAKERELMNLIEKKRQQLGQNNWKCVSVFLDAKNNDNTKYFVYYTARDNRGDEEEFVTLIQYKNGDWQMKLPGYDMADDLIYELYGLKMVD